MNKFNDMLSNTLKLTTVLLLALFTTKLSAQTIPSGKTFAQTEILNTVDQNTWIVTLDGVPKVWKRFHLGTLRAYVSPTVTSVANATALASLTGVYEGDIAVNAARDTIWIRDDSAWIIFKAGTGGGSSSFASLLASNPSAGGSRITNLGTPTAETDATTKNYVDSKVLLTNVKPTVFSALVVVDTVGIDSVWLWNTSVYRLLQTGSSTTVSSKAKIKAKIPAIGLSANESVSNYSYTSVNKHKYKFSTVPLGSPSTEYGGWLANGESGDSIRVLAPFWVIIGDSQAEGHPATHSRLHPSLDLFKPDVAGQLSYHLRLLTKYRWYNHGIGGQTSAQVLARFDRDALGYTSDPGDGRGSKTLSGKPHGVVIVAGINDFYSGLTVDQCKTNLTQMAVKCQSEGIYCVMLNIPGDEVISETQSKQVDDVNAWLASGALNQYNVIVVDYNTWWRDPAYNDNAHASNLIVDDIHPSAVGYDSLANYIFREAALPVLKRVIVYNEVSPTSAITGFSRPSSIKLDKNAIYSLASAVDSFTVTLPITSDSVWFSIRSSQNISGTSYSGFSHIEWLLDNGSSGTAFDLSGYKINDMLYPYVTIDPKNNPQSPILQNRPIQRNYSTSFGPYYSATDVAVGTSPYTHSGKGGFLIQLPDYFDSFFGIVELEFSGANTHPVSGMKVSFNNHSFSVEYTGQFATIKPYTRVVGNDNVLGDYYIVVGDSTITWSYTVCRVKQITSFFGFSIPDMKNTTVSFSTTPKTFVASKARIWLAVGDYTASGSNAWTNSGNSGIISTQYLGTNDAVDLRIKTNNILNTTFKSGGGLTHTFGTNTLESNIADLNAFGADYKAILRGTGSTSDGYGALFELNNYGYTYLRSSSTSSDESRLYFESSRGTIASPLTKLAGDRIGGLYFRAYSPTGWKKTSAIVNDIQAQNGNNFHNILKFGVSNDGSDPEVGGQQLLWLATGGTASHGSRLSKVIARTDFVVMGTVGDTAVWLRYNDKNFFKRGIGAGIPHTGTISALLHMGAGTTAAGTAPAKYTAGPVMTTPEAGAKEYDGTNFYSTISDNTRAIDLRGLKGSATLSFGTLAPGATASLTVTVTGAATTDSGVSFNYQNTDITGVYYSAKITGANTVTITCTNLSGSSQTPTSGTCYVTVIK